MTMRLIDAAMAAQFLDLATMDPARELNPVALSPLGPALKVALVLALFVGYALRLRYWRAVLVVALVVGLAGVASNVLP